MAKLEPLRGPRLEALLESLPGRPGVYLMRDLAGRVIYVGKAKSLKNRVRSYFRASGDERLFVSRLDRILGDIQVVVTPSEKDALILERELIGRHHPRFNIDLKDDKNFLSIRITGDSAYPRLMLNRRPPAGERQGKRAGRWFGPYTSAASIRQTFRLIQSVFQLRICSDSVFSKRRRPCLQYQMERCLGPCVLEVPPEQYARQVRQTVRFLSGRTDQLVAELETRMQAASRALDFEEAARLRDRIRAVTNSIERRQMIDLEQKDRDVLGFYREGASGLVLLMRIRQGYWLGVHRFPFRRTEAPDTDLLRQFLTQHYDSGADLPPEVLLPGLSRMRDELTVLSDWLTERRRKKVRVRIPQKGKPAKLVRVAQDNAVEAFRVSQAVAGQTAEKLERLKNRLGLTRQPERIECFDLSTLGGRHSVGSMAVLQGGEPQPRAYRRYRIKSAQPDSDLDMMCEVLKRRFGRVLEGEEEGPDLVVLDGGRGQLRAVQALFADLGVADVDLVALAKGRLAGRGSGRRTERVFLPGRKNPVPLRPESDELFLLARVRDEAHRFALAYHRKLRKKKTLKSGLEEIPGVGPVLRRRLLTHFRNLKGIREASPGELARAPGISKSLADRIYGHFRAGGTENS